MWLQVGQGDEDNITPNKDSGRFGKLIERAHKEGMVNEVEIENK